MKIRETFLVVPWLTLHTSNAEGMGLTPGRRTKILHAAWPKNKTNK